MIPFLFETLVILLALFIPWYTIKAIRLITHYLLKLKEFELDEAKIRKLNFLKARPFRHVWTLSIMLISSFILFGFIFHGERKLESPRTKLASKNTFSEESKKEIKNDRQSTRDILGIPSSTGF